MEAGNKDDELHLMLTGGFCEPPYPPPSLTKVINQQVSLHPETIIYAPHNQLSFFSAHAIHTVPLNTSGHEINRCLVRIACSADYFDKAGGPTINPCLGPLGPFVYFPYFDLPNECAEAMEKISLPRSKRTGQRLK